MANAISRPQASDQLRDMLLARRALGVADATLVLHGPVSQSPWSKVYFGRGSAYGMPVVVKLCIDPNTGLPSPEVATATFRALDRFAKVTALEPSLGSPKPIELWEEEGVVVAEWIDGPTLETVFRGGPPSAACAGAEKAGRWLARLHHAAGWTSRPLLVHRPLGELDELMRDKPAAFRRPTLAAAAQLLHDTAERAASRPVPWTQALGDFKPANLLLREGRLFGIDMLAGAPGPGVNDAAHFLNHTAMTFSRRSVLQPFEVTGRLQDAFRRGYANGGMELPAMQLIWIRLMNAVRLGANYQSWSRPPRAWITGWMLARLVGSLAAELSGLPPDSPEGDPPANTQQKRAFAYGAER